MLETHGAVAARDFDEFVRVAHPLELGHLGCPGR
jgi:hypothetical protein